MNLLIDTNRYTDFVRGDPVAVRTIQSAGRIFLPFVAVGELRAGFACGTKARENEATLTCVLQQSTVSVLYADADTTRHYAAIFQQLRTQGTPIPPSDLWIGALAIQHDLILFSRDPHFLHLPQLARI